MKVFIIDDDPEELEIMTEAISDITSSIETHVCSDPEDAVSFLKDIENTPDVILIDNMMQKLKAAEVIQKIKLLPHLIATRIVVLSSQVSPIDAAVLKDLGVEVFKKGLSFKSIITSLRVILFPNPLPGSANTQQV